MTSALDPLQFAYRQNRSTALHSALSHLDNNNTYVRILFIDFSSAFNTIIPSKLITKLSDLGINTSLCNWVLDFLTNRPQSVRLENHTSSTLILNTGIPQGCVLSPFLYSLFTNDCTPVHGSNTIIKFADDTTVVGFISNNDELAYREEVRHLAEWCAGNNLALNTKKTKELIVDFRKKAGTHKKKKKLFFTKGVLSNIKFRVPIILSSPFLSSVWNDIRLGFFFSDFLCFSNANKINKREYQKHL